MITVITQNPAGLLQEIISNINSGSVETWAVDDDGDFTHTPAQWNCAAWLRPSQQNGKLCFYILGPSGKHLSVEVYAVYHGRFIEMLLAHFDGRFTVAFATAQPAEEDRIGSQ